MGWRWRRTLKFGPVRTTFSQRGVGNSFDFFGFRFRVTADSKKYWSFGIKGTGLYYIKYC